LAPDQEPTPTEAALPPQSGIPNPPAPQVPVGAPLPYGYGAAPGVRWPPFPGYGPTGPFPGYGPWPPPAQAWPGLRPLQEPYSSRKTYVPGPILVGLLTLVMSLAIVGSSGPDLEFLAWTSILAGLTIGLLWLLLLIVAAQDTHLRFDRRTWARWGSMPAIFFLAVALMQSGFPAVSRFEFSRAAFEQAAANAQAGATFEPQTIGTYQVNDVTTNGDITQFTLSDSGDGECVLVYAGTDTKRLNQWLANNTWEAKSYGHGWWYSCGGGPSD